MDYQNNFCFLWYFTFAFCGKTTNPYPPRPSHDNPEWSPYLGLHKDGYRFSASRFLPVSLGQLITNNRINPPQITE